jgi:DNA ligase (NAD+)
MLSLGNTYNEQELLDFDERVQKGLEGQSYEYICELKFDGVALSVWYENGIITRGVTRGDGVRGDDITANVKTIRTLPLKVMANELPAQFEVRGEGFLPLASFEAINKERGYWRSSIGKSKKCGLGYFQNAGFFCGGQRKLDFYVYQFCLKKRFLIHMKKVYIGYIQLGLMFLILGKSTIPFKAF